MSNRAPASHSSATALIAASLAGLITLAAACSSKPPEAAAAAANPSGFKVTAAQRARLTIIAAAKTSFQPTLDVTGTVAFNGDRSTQVLSQISGPVTRILVSLGSNVTAGQTLATVLSPDFAAAVAGYRKAEDAARNTQRILKLDEQLFQNDALARSDLDQARTDASSAAADQQAALLALQSIGIPDSTIAAIRDGKQTKPADGVIVSPIAGTVVEKFLNPGQLLQLVIGASPAFTVADLSSMWVFASVYGADVGLVAAGEAVDVITDASPKPVSARVDYVAPIVDPGTKATSVRIVAENPGQLLKRDMFVQVRIHSKVERNGILVPASAVLRDDDNLPFVFVANADSTFGRRRVTLGLHVGDKYEIPTGLVAGEKVVGDGALFIQFAESQ